MPITVTIMLPENGVFRDVLVGFHRIAADRGWMLVKQTRLWDTNPIQPDAVICTAETWTAAEPEIRRAKPFVCALTDMSGEGVPSVVVDEPAVAVVAAEHLLSRGLRSFGVYGLHGHANCFATLRAEAFRQAVVTVGGRFTGWGEDFKAVLASSDVEWTHQVTRWLRAMPKPAGIFTCCDKWAERLMAECWLLGLKIPEEVTVVGVDNDAFVCEMLTPALSSVIIPWERIGRELALLLEKRLRGEPAPPAPVVVPPGDVFPRRSSDFWAVNDPKVAAALSFIRDNADRLIGVSDVLRHACTYRQDLQQRFRRQIGCTIMDEVRRVHMERAKQLLSTTDLSVQEVAERSGFADGRRLAEAFQRDLGQSPRKYRRLYRLRG